MPSAMLVLLDEIEQAFPDALLRPANEQLRRQPPRAKLGRDAAPLRAVLVPPENRRDRPPQLFGRRLPARPDLLDQRLPYRPRRIRQNLCGAHIDLNQFAFSPGCLGVWSKVTAPIEPGFSG